MKVLLNMEMTVIAIGVGVHGTICKKTEKRFGKLAIRGRNMTIQTTALLRSVKVLSRVLEIR